MSEEIWKDIVGYEGIYKISNTGNVFSFLSKKILKQIKNGNGYLCVFLRKNGKTKKVDIHRLLAIHFIDNPLNKPYCDHVDGNRTNNSLDNLRWVSISENCMNRTKQINNTSGIVGVNFNKRCKKYHVRIKLNKKTIHGGYFISLEDAIKKRKELEEQYFKEFTSTH